MKADVDANTFINLKNVYKIVFYRRKRICNLVFCLRSYSYISKIKIAESGIH